MVPLSGGDPLLLECLHSDIEWLCPPDNDRRTLIIAFQNPAAPVVNLRAGQTERERHLVPVLLLAIPREDSFFGVGKWLYDETKGMSKCTHFVSGQRLKRFMLIPHMFHMDGSPEHFVARMVPAAMKIVATVGGSWAVLDMDVVISHGDNQYSTGLLSRPFEVVAEPCEVVAARGRAKSE
jgi:hypothetical protein